MTREQKIQEIQKFIDERPGTMQQLSESSGVSVTMLYRLKRDAHLVSDVTVTSTLLALKSQPPPTPANPHEKYVKLSEALVMAFGNRKAASIFGIAPGTMYGYRQLPGRLAPLHDDLLAEARKHPEAVPFINEIYGTPPAEPEIDPEVRSRVLRAKAAEALLKHTQPVTINGVTVVTVPAPQVTAPPTPQAPEPAAESAAPSVLDLKNSEWKVVVRKDLDKCIIYGKRMVFKSLDNVHVLVQIGE
jgi:hypothetical protein